MVKQTMWVIVLSVVGLVGLAAFLPVAEARGIRGELMEPSGGAPFGGDVVGAYRITFRSGGISINAWIELAPSSGYTFEGWLVDMQTEYKLSLGALSAGDGDDDDDGSGGRWTLGFCQRMVNPFTYGVLVITAEPVGDPDPNPAMPVAGALLPEPFGQ